MKLNIKFGSGYKYVSFDHESENNEIIVDSYGDRKTITDQKILKKFVFFFKNVNFSWNYTEYYQDFHEVQTQLCMNCVSKLERMDFSRLVNFVDDLTSTDKKSVQVRFFKNNQNIVFAMQDHNIISLYGNKNGGFINKVSRNDFLCVKKNQELKALYVGGVFKPVFESLL